MTRALQQAFLTALFPIAACVMLCAGTAHADIQEMMSSQAYSLGGANTSRPNGIFSLLSNPAGIAEVKGFDLALHFGTLDYQNNDMVDRVKRLGKTNPATLDPESPAAADYLSGLRNLDQEGTMLRGSRFLGVGLAYRSFGVGIHQYEIYEVVPRVDQTNVAKVAAGEPNSLTENRSSYSARGVKATQIDLTVGYPFGEFFVGTTNRYITASTFWYDAPLAGARGEVESLRDRALNTNETTDGIFSGDLGVMYYNPAVAVGVVARNLYNEGLRTEKRGVLAFDKQYRAGVSFGITPDMIICADYDIAPYRSFGVLEKLQNLSLGTEAKVAEFLKLRFGVQWNTAAERADLMYGGGADFMFKKFGFHFGYVFGNLSSPVSLTGGIRVRF